MSTSNATVAASVLLQLKIAIEEWHPFTDPNPQPGKAQAIGFLTIALPQIGLRIRDLKVYERPDRERFISYPSRKYETKHGLPQYSNYVEMRSAKEHRAFQEAILHELATLEAQPQTSF